MSNLNIIIDASVLAKWFLPSEEESELALTIRDDFAASRFSISFPSLVFYEVSNLLKSAVLRSRLNREKAVKIYQDFLELDFEIYLTDELLRNSLEIALKSDISSYDAAYVALAQYLRAPLFTADQKLLKKAKSRFVKNLKTYPS